MEEVHWHLLRRVHPSHALTLFSGIELAGIQLVACLNCGAFLHKRVQSLAHPCGAHTSRGLKAQRKRMQQGWHPLTDNHHRWLGIQAQWHFSPDDWHEAQLAFQNQPAQGQGEVEVLALPAYCI
eukprot:2121251-Amphidinium_carterae.1